MIDGIIDKYLTEGSEKLDIKFIKSVANDYGHSISDADAKKAHKMANSHSGNGQDYYDKLKEYFG